MIRAAFDCFVPIRSLRLAHLDFFCTPRTVGFDCLSRPIRPTLLLASISPSRFVRLKLFVSTAPLDCFVPNCSFRSGSPRFYVRFRCSDFIVSMFLPRFDVFVPIRPFRVVRSVSIRFSSLRSFVSPRIVCFDGLSRSVRPLCCHSTPTFRLVRLKLLVSTAPFRWLFAPIVRFV